MLSAAVIYRGNVAMRDEPLRAEGKRESNWRRAIEHGGRHGDERIAGGSVARAQQVLCVRCRHTRYAHQHNPRVERPSNSHAEETQAVAEKNGRVLASVRRLENVCRNTARRQYMGRRGRRLRSGRWYARVRNATSATEPSPAIRASAYDQVRAVGGIHSVC